LVPQRSRPNAVLYRRWATVHYGTAFQGYVQYENYSSCKHLAGTLIKVVNWGYGKSAEG